MKKLVITFCFLLTVVYTNAQSTIAGVWDIGKENTKIEIKEEGGVYKGTIISSDNAKAKGKVLLKDVKASGNEWKGKFFAPQKKKWMNAVITEKANKLFVKVKAGMMSKTLEWTKE